MDLMRFSEPEQHRLLQVARESIAYYLDNERRIKIDLTREPDTLIVKRASFVTLMQEHKLRGCIGHLQATQPLVLDVARNAIAAATQDYRFKALTRRELPVTAIHISVLTEPQRLQVENELDLYRQLKSKVDGVVLTYKDQQATFLPSVWESLPTPEQFIKQLKLKAGLNELFWDDEVKIDIYQSQSFGDESNK